ncbi:MiaB/RimO family radical SAM methylthiotransferase [Patescibacteria group bacterium]
MQNYYITTYGCQMNKSDSERIATVLENVGYKVCSKEEDADLIVVVSCSVRQTAVDRIYGRGVKYKKLEKENPNLKTILTGCLLDEDKKKLADKFDVICDIREIEKISDLIKCKKIVIPRLTRDPEFTKFCLNNWIPPVSTIPSRTRRSEAESSLGGHQVPCLPCLPDRQAAGRRNDKKVIDCVFRQSEPIDSIHNKKKLDYSYLSIPPKHSSLFKAYIPIMTGCNNFCSYCVVPYTRGREYSRPADEILNEARQLIQNGYKEITLIGQNVNSYNGKINFPSLLREINFIPGDFWIRFATSHPKDMSDELITTISECEKITPYIHLPIQSGSDKILKAMNRKYTKNHYLNLIKKIKSKIPNVMLSTDIIVGFPNETEADFNETVDVFKKVKYSMAYIAKYSTRKGTVAGSLADNVTQEEKARRENVLTDILKQTALENNKKFIGKTVKVLIEKKFGNYYIGKTDQFINVKVDLSERRDAQVSSVVFINCKIMKVASFGMEAK